MAPSLLPPHIAHINFDRAEAQLLLQLLLRRLHEVLYLHFHGPLVAAVPLAAAATAAAQGLRHRCPCWQGPMPLASQQALPLQQHPQPRSGAAQAAAVRMAAGLAEWEAQPGCWRPPPPPRCCHHWLQGQDCSLCRRHCRHLSRCLDVRDQQAPTLQKLQPPAALPLKRPVPRPLRPQLPLHLLAGHSLPAHGGLPDPAHLADPADTPAPADVAGAAARQPLPVRAAATVPGAAPGQAPAGSMREANQWSEHCSQDGRSVHSERGLKPSPPPTPPPAPGPRCPARACSPHPPAVVDHQGRATLG